MPDETKIVVRQEKDFPSGWHVAAQGKNEEEMRGIAKDLARSENDTFAVKQEGDVIGNNVDFFLLDKSDLAEWFGQTI